MPRWWRRGSHRGTANAVPIGVTEEYIKLTALVSASSFGKTGDPALWAPLEKRVRTYSQVKQSQGAEILARVASVHDSLVADASVSWASTAIPQAAFDEYVALTTAQIAPVFGVTVDPATLPPIAARVKRIALIMQGQTLAEDRVATVHDELVGNGYASWALNAIPQAVADDYTALVQFQVSNAFDMHTDVANLVPSLEARVKRFALVLQAQALAEARVNAIHDELVGSAHVSWAAIAIPQAVSRRLRGADHDQAGAGVRDQGRSGWHPGDGSAHPAFLAGAACSGSGHRGRHRGACRPGGAAAR